MLPYHSESRILNLALWLVGQDQNLGKSFKLFPMGFVTWYISRVKLTGHVAYSIFCKNYNIRLQKKYWPHCVGVRALTVHSHVSDSWPFDLASKQLSIKNSEFLGESKCGILKFQKGAFKNYVDMFFFNVGVGKETFTRGVTFWFHRDTSECSVVLNLLGCSAGKIQNNESILGYLAKLYIPSTLNIDLILWHPQLIVDAVKC